MGILLRHWSTVAQLAIALGVSKATAQRDLDLLSDLFVVSTRVDRRKHNQRRYYRMPGRFVPRARSV
jgi:predicted DNA-binding transcriptional regulator YafY